MYLDNASLSMWIFPEGTSITNIPVIKLKLNDTNMFFQSPPRNIVRGLSMSKGNIPGTDEKQLLLYLLLRYLKKLPKRS